MQSEVNKYKCTKNCVIDNTLILIGDFVYISDKILDMRSLVKLYYRKVFSNDCDYIGDIGDFYFIEAHFKLVE